MTIHGGLVARAQTIAVGKVREGNVRLARNKFKACTYDVPCREAQSSVRPADFVTVGREKLVLHAASLFTPP